MAAALAVLYLALLARREGRWRHYGGLGVASAILLWVHYVPALLLPLVYLWVIPRRPWSGRKWGQWAVALAIPVLTLAPRLPQILAGAGEVAGIESSGFQQSLRGVALKLVLPGYAAVVGETILPWVFWVTVPLAVAGLLLWGRGLVAAAKEMDPGKWMKLVLWPLAVFSVVMLLSTVATAEPWPRVTSLSMYALPFFYITMAQGARAWPRPVAFVLVGVFVRGPGWGLANYFRGEQFLNPGYNTPWKEVNRLLEEKAQPGEPVVAFYDETLRRYLTAPVSFHDLKEVEEAQEIAEGAEPARGDRGVWVVSRDRGSEVARSHTTELLEVLRERGGQEEVYYFHPRTAEEQRWRGRIQGYEAPEAYLKVHHFTFAREGAAERKD
jgi:hypothetical protein